MELLKERMMSMESDLMKRVNKCTKGIVISFVISVIIMIMYAIAIDLDFYVSVCANIALVCLISLWVYAIANLAYILLPSAFKGFKFKRHEEKDDVK